MDALTAETELISDSLERDASRAKCHDLVIPNGVSRWSRAEWSPFPAGDSPEYCCSFWGEESRPLALADVSDPCSEVYGSPVGDVFGVGCRDSCVSGAEGVEVECFEVLVPSVCVVHVVNHTSS